MRKAFMIQYVTNVFAKETNGDRYVMDVLFTRVLRFNVFCLVFIYWVCDYKQVPASVARHLSVRYDQHSSASPQLPRTAHHLQS